MRICFKGTPYGRPNAPLQDKNDKCIFVRNLSEETTVTDLSEFFQKFGSIANVSINVDKHKVSYSIVCESMQINDLIILECVTILRYICLGKYIYICLLDIAAVGNVRIGYV